jgi:hypothetical protein
VFVRVAATIAGALRRPATGSARRAETTSQMCNTAEISLKHLIPLLRAQYRRAGLWRVKRATMALYVRRR